jgi:rfaE bifunctional protein nucleotidyltransferase chain/domain
MWSSPAPIYSDVGALIAHIDRARAGRIVLANGCFDPLHVGHVRYLAGAKAHGDFLVVALNNDESTRLLKGPSRPAVPEADRAALLAAVAVVDAVVVFGDATVAGILERLRPAVHAKGTDYTVATVPELDVSKRLGVETVIVGDPKSHASRDVVAEIRRKGGR